jgi:hypothetical protein
LKPAVSGDALVIWGTGLGGQVRDDVIVSFGLLSARAFYAGPAPGLAGVDQINVFLPSGLTNSCFLPFVVHAGAQQSSVYTLSTASVRGSECSMPLALGREGLEALDRGDVVRITALTIQPLSAEAWVGEYDAAHLSQLATYDTQPWGTIVECRSRGYRYNRWQPAVRTLVPVELYGMRRVPSLIIASVTGPGNCAWSFTLVPDGVYRAEAPPGCPAERYSIRHPADVQRADGNVPFDLPMPPFPEVTFDRATGAVSWRENFSGRLTLDLSSSFSLGGNIFSGETFVHEMACRLSGTSGSGRINEGDLRWALGLPTTQAVAVRQWYGSLITGSWGSPHDALLIRMFRVVAVPVAGL